MKKLFVLFAVVLFVSCVQPETETKYVDRPVEVSRYAVEYQVTSDIGFVELVRWQSPYRHSSIEVERMYTPFSIGYDILPGNALIYAYTRDNAEITVSVFINGQLRLTDRREKDSAGTYAQVFIEDVE
jgi:hypothetical protein